MKALAVSLALFVTVIAAVIFNAAYISKTVEQMKSLSLAVCEEDDTEKAVSKLSEYWETHEKYVSISANLRDIDKITEEILKLKSSCELNNEIGIHQSCALLCDALDDIHKHEIFSIDSIF